MLSAVSGLWHFTDHAVAEGPFEVHNYSQNLAASIGLCFSTFLFSQLRTRCNPQQFFCDTVTVVHMHPPEAD